MFKGALALLLTTWVAEASQDSAFYPNFANPNVFWSDLYYREAVNVLQDLATGEFDALFIRYHGCVWSEYGSDGDDGDDDNDVGCNPADGGEDSGWYLGNTQCFRPNVAYALYGIKKGGVLLKEGACSKTHYINSFFTNYGIESFGDSVGFDYDNYGVYTGCTVSGDDDEEDEDRNSGEEREHMSQVYPNAVSVGLACSASGGFVTAAFTGGSCEGHHFKNITTTHSKMNSALDSLGCMMIYSSGNQQYNNQGNNNQENNYQEDADGDGDDDGGERKLEENDGASYGAYYLLQASSACSLAEYPYRCPDPHGIKARRDKALQSTARVASRNVPLIMPIMSSAMLLLGVYFFKKSGDLKMLVLKRSLEADPMDQARDEVAAERKSIAYQMSESFARTATDVSNRTRSIKEALIAYAMEEEEDELEPKGGLHDVVKEKEEDEHEEADGLSRSSSKKSLSKKISLRERISSIRSIGSRMSVGSRKSVSSKKSTTSKKSTSGLLSESGTIATAPPALSPAATAAAGETTEEPAPVEKSGSGSDSDGVMVANNEQVANAMLTEKGLPPRPKSTSSKTKNKKKYKRPRLAKVSRFFFGKKVKSSNASI